MNKPLAPSEADRNVLIDRLSKPVLTDIGRLIQGIEEAQAYGHVLIEIHFRSGKVERVKVSNEKTFTEGK